MDATPSVLKHVVGGALVLLLVISGAAAAYQQPPTANFTFNSFSGDSRRSLTLDGAASITSTGLLSLTNFTSQVAGHVFYSSPFQFKQPAGSGGRVPGNETVSSFSSTFVFTIVSEFPNVLSGHGVAFVVSKSKDLSNGIASRYLGLFDTNNNGNATNHVLAVELDTIQDTQFRDKYNNHVGIDINSLDSIVSRTAGWYSGDSESTFRKLDLISGDPIQVWVDYDGEADQLDVTLAPCGITKPLRPLLSQGMLNLPDVLLDTMYVGFSASTGSILASHYILGWSFAVGNGAWVPPLDLSSLLQVPRHKAGARARAIAVPVFIVFWMTTAILGGGVSAAVIAVRRRRKKFAEVMEDWEVEYGPQRYKYRELYVAAKGFKDKGLLGVGGFGRVYRGVLQGRTGGSNDEQEVAIKRVSHDSQQGIQEFVAEISCLGQLRHRNLVQLLGYCRRKGELLLVYEYMPNGSLDQYLHAHDQKPDGTAAATPLSWSTRFHIIKGVAAGLLYLHEDWDKVVIHRDIKASNVLLDADMNGRLSDFGLARLHDHDCNARTTRVAGTMGYLAPELARTGRASTGTDVFAFGVFLLEVACGRRPILPVIEDSEEPPLLLVDWVASKWKLGNALETVDFRLRGQFAADEAELVLKLGLLCSHPVHAARPSMRQAVQYLHKSVPMPELSADLMDATTLDILRNQGFNEFTAISVPSCGSLASDVWHSISGGR